MGFFVLADIRFRQRWWLHGPGRWWWGQFVGPRWRRYTRATWRRNVRRPFGGPGKFFEAALRRGLLSRSRIEEFECLFGRPVAELVAVVVRRWWRRLRIRREIVQRADRAVALFVESHAVGLENRAGLLFQVGQQRVVIGYRGGFADDRIAPVADRGQHGQVVDQARLKRGELDADVLLRGFASLVEGYVLGVGLIETAERSGQCVRGRMQALLQIGLIAGDDQLALAHCGAGGAEADRYRKIHAERPVGKLTRGAANDAAAVGHFAFQSVPAIEGHAIELWERLVVGNDELLLVGFEDQLQLDEIRAADRGQIDKVLPLGPDALKERFGGRNNLSLVPGRQTEQVSQRSFLLQDGSVGGDDLRAEL